MADVVNKFEVAGNFFLSGINIDDIFEPVGAIRTITTPAGDILTGENVTLTGQTLSLTGSELSISDGNMVDLTEAIPEIDVQTISFTDNKISITRGNEIDLSVFEQTLTLSGDVLSISDSNSVNLGNFEQNLTFNNNILSLSNGNDVDLSNLSQTLSYSGTELTISDGNTVDLSNLAEDLDNQTLSLSNNTLSISNGNDVDLSSMSQTLSFNGGVLSITDGNDVDLSSMNQSLSYSGTNLTISDGNTVDLSNLAEELDNQTLSLSDNQLTISNGNTVDLSSMNQSLSVSGTELTITDGNTVDLSFLAEELDNQTLSLSGNTLSVSNGNSVDLSAMNQSLTLSGNTLSLSDGNSVDLASLEATGVSPVFITSVTNNNGLLQDTYIQGTIPADKIVSAITVDDDSNLDVTIEWDGPTDEWMGSVYINDVEVTTGITQIGSTRRFTATVNVDLDGAENLIVSGNGTSHTVPVTLLGGGPVVSNVSFSSPPTYDGHQHTMFLDGDTVDITMTFNTTDVASISLDGGNDTATRSINDDSVTVTDNGDGTSSLTYTTTIDTTLSTETQVPVKISAKNSFGTEGDEHTSTATIPVRAGPEITAVTFGSYPGSQTELKDNDQISIDVTFDTNNVSQIQLTSSGYASSNQTKTINPSSLSDTVTITIDTSVTTAEDQSIRLRARTISGSYGNYHVSANKVTVNNVGPTYSSYSVSYPAGQSAIKDNELAVVRLTISNVGSNPTYTYTAPSGEISIPDTSTYSVAKNCTGTSSGNYNVSSNNYAVSVNRAENNKTTSYSNVVNIADTLPTLTVSGLPSVMRSGGGENTSPQTYTVTVTSTQQLASFTMDTAANAGTLTGSWNGSNNNTTWTRNLQITDDDLKGVFNWTSITAVNLSDESQTSISSGSSYELGGFVSRSLTISALSRTRSLGTAVSDPSNLTISETFRGSISFDSTIADGATLDPDISTGVDVASKFTIVDSGDLTTVDYGGDTFFYLDRVAVNNNVSGTSVITVEEST